MAVGCLVRAAEVRHNGVRFPLLSPMDRGREPSPRSVGSCPTQQVVRVGEARKKGVLFEARHGVYYTRG